MKIKANTIKEITSIKIKGADAMHSLDSYFQRTTAPKSAAQERREEFQEKVMRSADYIVTCSPAAGSCAVLVSFTVCHRCVEIQERAFTRLAVPTALSALCDVQWFCPMQ